MTSAVFSYSFSENLSRKDFLLTELKWLENRHQNFSDAPRTPQEIKPLLEKLILPNEWDLVVDLIFQLEKPSTIKVFLEAVNLAKPELGFSPLNQLRKEIALDEQNTMTSRSLVNKGIKDLTPLYQFAFQMRRYNLYEPSSEVIPPRDYSLHFLWINLNPQDRVKNIAINIFGEGTNSWENHEAIADSSKLEQMDRSDRENIQNTFLYRLLKWADLHQAPINLWFDSALVTERSLANTESLLRRIAISRKASIRLRDLRSIELLKSEKYRNLLCSMHPATPVYYRVDLLKILISDTTFRTKESKFSAIVDIDVKPMPPEQLFDQRTLGYLSKVGYVFGRACEGNYENCFAIYNTSKNELCAIQERTILERMERDLKTSRTEQVPTTYSSETIFFLLFYYIDEANQSHPEMPVKLVDTPNSCFRSPMMKSMHGSELFYFTGDSEAPITIFGRNYDSEKPSPIPSLKDWRPSSLPSQSF